MRTFILVWLTLAGCALFRPPPKAEPAKQTRATPDCAKKTSIDVLTGMMREFGRALDEKDFDGAAELLEDAQGCVANASETMRSHPEFDDTQASVARGQKRLAAAVATDRQERANAAIQEIVVRAQRLADRGGVILAELEHRMPTAEDLRYIEEIITEFQPLVREGAEYASEQRYQKHAAVRDEFLAGLVRRRSQAVWQLALSKSLQAPTSDLVAGAERVRMAQSPEQRAQMIEQLREASSRCLQRITETQSEPTFAAGRLIETKLGRLSVADTQRKCMSAARTGSAKGGGSQKSKGGGDRADSEGSAVKATGRRGVGSAARRRKAQKRKGRRKKKGRKGKGRGRRD